MTPAVRDHIARRLDADVARATPVSGGDINEAYRVELSDGRAVFVKTNRHADPRMFSCEAAGLAWLDQPGAIRLPRTIAVTDPDQPTQWLALEWIDSGPRAHDFDERLGRELAALHRAGPDGFGLASDNFIATLDQANQACATWAEFYAQRRLLPLVRRAIDQRGAPARWIGQFDRLCARLDELVGPAEPPARLHGDLWSGNLHVDERGLPCLIDPAVYGGHREIDLAMLDLFGTVPDDMLAAYHEVYPLAPGRHERVRLYQLYPLLVHVNLFGHSYVGSVDSALRRFL